MSAGLGSAARLLAIKHTSRRRPLADSFTHGLAYSQGDYWQHDGGQASYLLQLANEHCVLAQALCVTRGSLAKEGQVDGF